MFFIFTQRLDRCEFCTSILFNKLKLISMYDFLRSIYHRFRFYLKINWYKTLYFNFKMFPFSIAIKLPVYIYEWVKFNDLSGEIVIDAPIKRGMIGFGQPYEMTKRSLGIAEFEISGKVIFKGYFQSGKDLLLVVKKGAVCEFGNMSSIARMGKIICVQKITLGNFARLGSESQIIDTNFHIMVNTLTNEPYQLTMPVYVGNYNFISNRVTILQKTITPDYTTIASNTLCNKDYSKLGNNILIGGVPAKLLRENISRDWEGEREKLENSLIVK